MGLGLAPLFLEQDVFENKDTLSTFFAFIKDVLNHESLERAHESPNLRI